MSFASDLLEQAEHLAKREKKKPKQASLHRAISSAYYAMFHWLTELAVQQMFSAGSGFRPLIRRKFEHSQMRDVCKTFANGKIPPYFSTLNIGGVPNDLKFIANTFVEMQAARHGADYDIDKTYSRTEARDLIAKVRSAEQKWNAIQNHPAARAMLAALLIGTNLRS